MTARHSRRPVAAALSESAGTSATLLPQMRSSNQGLSSRDRPSSFVPLASSVARVTSAFVGATNKERQWRRDRQQPKKDPSPKRTRSPAPNAEGRSAVPPHLVHTAS